MKYRTEQELREMIISQAFELAEVKDLLRYYQEERLKERKAAEISKIEKV
jgi:hypothetical protein